MTSPLTKSDLISLGIPPGEVFGKIFKVTSGLCKEDAVEVAKQIRDGTWNTFKVKGVKLTQDSVWAFFVAHPCFTDFSRGEIKRMIEQGAIRLNWHNDWNADDEMPKVITELTLFPSGSRKTILWCLSCINKGDSCLGHSAALV